MFLELLLLVALITVTSITIKYSMKNKDKCLRITITRIEKNIKDVKKRVNIYSNFNKYLEDFCISDLAPVSKNPWQCKIKKIENPELVVSN